MVISMSKDNNQTARSAPLLTRVGTGVFTAGFECFFITPATYVAFQERSLTGMIKYTIANWKPMFYESWWDAKYTAPFTAMRITLGITLRGMIENSEYEYQHLLKSVGAFAPGAIVSLVSSPSEMVKTRLQTLQQHNHHESFIDAFYKIYSEVGLKGMMKIYMPFAIGGGIQTTGFFYIAPEIKKQLDKIYPSEILSTSLAFASTGFAMAVLNHPCEVIKKSYRYCVRNENYKTIEKSPIEICKWSIDKIGGTKNIYGDFLVRGVNMSVNWVGKAMAIMFMGYQWSADNIDIHEPVTNNNATNESILIGAQEEDFCGVEFIGD